MRGDGEETEERVRGVCVRGVKEEETKKNREIQCGLLNEVDL